jgi:hypothetical protein
VKTEAIGTDKADATNEYSHTLPSPANSTEVATADGKEPAIHAGVLHEQPPPPSGQSVETDVADLQLTPAPSASSQPEGKEADYEDSFVEESKTVSPISGEAVPAELVPKPAAATTTVALTQLPTPRDASDAKAEETAANDRNVEAHDESKYDEGWEEES